MPRCGLFGVSEAAPLEVGAWNRSRFLGDARLELLYDGEREEKGVWGWPSRDRGSLCGSLAGRRMCGRRRSGPSGRVRRRITRNGKGRRDDEAFWCG